MNILITGGSGFIGRHLTAALQAQGHQVHSVSRREGVNFNTLVRLDDWLPYLHGIDAVINAVGIIGEGRGQRFNEVHTQAPSALFRACAQLGVRRVIQISALGADEQASTAYHLSKRAADECLRGLDLDGFILRPSLVYGLGGASSSLFMALARLPLIPVIDNGQQLIQPVHISDLVATVARCLVSKSAQLTLDVVGPDVVTFSQWLQCMRSSQGLGPGRFISVPFWFALAGAQLGGWLSPLLQPDNLRMLQAGNFADVGPLSEFLGRKPIAAKPHLFLDVGANHDL